MRTSGGVYHILFEQTTRLHGFSVIVRGSAILIRYTVDVCLAYTC